MDIELIKNHPEKYRLIAMAYAIVDRFLLELDELFDGLARYALPKKVLSYLMSKDGQQAVNDRYNFVVTERSKMLQITSEDDYLIWILAGKPQYGEEIDITLLHTSFVAYTVQALLIHERREEYHGYI
jgi:hypothetical protein